MTLTSNVLFVGTLVEALLTSLTSIVLRSGLWRKDLHPTFDHLFFKLPLLFMLLLELFIIISIILVVSEITENLRIRWHSITTTENRDNLL